MTTETTLAQLRRARWVLWGLAVAAAALAWFSPLLWALVIVCLVLAVRNELVIRQGRRQLLARQ